MRLGVLLVVGVAGCAAPEHEASAPVVSAAKNEPDTEQTDPAREATIRKVNERLTEARAEEDSRDRTVSPLAAERGPYWWLSYAREHCHPTQCGRVMLWECDSEDVPKSIARAAAEEKCPALPSETAHPTVPAGGL